MEFENSIDKVEGGSQIELIAPLILCFGLVGQFPC